ncbi:MAG: hypothetical protein IJF83_00050 [Methanobrevibacter sp.]|nr:hypothetical protein [Methanobrevibacter sp.]
MVQVELDNCSNKGIFHISRKVYTMEDIDELVKPITSSKQISFPKGRMFCSYKDAIEIEWVKAAILDALNNPEKFYSPGDTFGATMKLQEMIKGNNCIVLRKEYGIPEKLEYRNTYEVNSIVDANHNDRVIIPITAGEILDLIADLNKNRKLEDIFEVYDWYHKDMTIELLELFQTYYRECRLNKLIKYICSKSNELGGFQDYGVGVVRNRLTTQYLFDSRKSGDGK